MNGTPTAERLHISKHYAELLLFSCFILLPDGGGGLCGGAGRAGGTPGRGGGGRFGSKPWVDSFSWVIGWKSAGERENNIKG